MAGAGVRASCAHLQQRGAELEPAAAPGSSSAGWAGEPAAAAAGAAPLPAGERCYLGRDPRCQAHRGAPGAALCHPPAAVRGRRAARRFGAACPGPCPPSSSLRCQSSLMSNKGEGASHTPGPCTALLPRRRMSPSGCAASASGRCRPRRGRTCLFSCTSSSRPSWPSQRWVPAGAGGAVASREGLASEGPAGKRWALLGWGAVRPRGSASRALSRTCPGPPCAGQACGQV